MRFIVAGVPEVYYDDIEKKVAEIFERGDAELELENRDLLITSRAKDMFIEQLRKDREAFVVERQQLIDQLISSSRQIGELETKLLQIEAPRERSERNPTVPNPADVEPLVTHEQVEHPPSY